MTLNILKLLIYIIMGFLIYSKHLLSLNNSTSPTLNRIENPNENIKCPSGTIVAGTDIFDGDKDINWNEMK